MAAPECVTVAVRCRPMSIREQKQREAQIVFIKGGGGESQAVCSLTVPQKGAPPREFSFDFAYGDESTQSTLYEDLGGAAWSRGPSLQQPTRPPTPLQQPHAAQGQAAQRLPRANPLGLRRA